MLIDSIFYLLNGELIFASGHFELEVPLFP